MHCVFAIAATVAVSLSAQATAAKESGFTIPQQATGKHKFLSGPIAIESTYLKYNKAVPAHIKAAAKAAAAKKGSVTATPEAYDEAYLCPVKIGTPKQTLMMDFDTGSSDLWVFSSQLPSNEQAGHTIYDPSSSSTSSQLTGESWRINYGDGSGASGNIYADKVVIGKVTATSQGVECATSVSSSFVSDTDNDGLVGLGFDNINTATPNAVETFFDNVQSSLAQPLFAAYLRKGEAGSYDFGYIDRTKYTGALTYVDVDSSNGFWQFMASGYAVGTTKHAASLDCIADTGTSLIYLPDAVIANYYAKVTGARNSIQAGGYIFPCSSTLPRFSLNIGGKLHRVPGAYLNYAPYTSTYCYGGLQSSSGIGFNILGDVFLKSQYVVFDGGNQRIGFAKQA